METWKDAVGFEGRYQVSNSGKVRNIKTGTIRKQTTDRYGYKYVVIKNDGKEKTCLVHRMVAAAFIPNPEALPQINHKDEDKKNNNSENLEWCTALYNTRYGTGQERAEKTMSRKERANRAAAVTSKRVLQYDKSGKFINDYGSSLQAQRETGICGASIRLCCTGRAKSAGGFFWKHA